jgi:hypothetical protein
MGVVQGSIPCKSIFLRFFLVSSMYPKVVVLLRSVWRMVWVQAVRRKAPGFGDPQSLSAVFYLAR